MLYLIGNGKAPELRVTADLQIHSIYSRATSGNMVLEEIARFAALKGLQVVGTGDLTHPKWQDTIKKTLVEVDGTGLYRLRAKPESSVLLMVTGEVNTIFDFEGKSRRIHHVILVPNVEVAEQVSERLAKFGDLDADGRPTLSATPAEVVEEAMSSSQNCMVFPSHAWTPWFGLFGANSGVDRLEDCYGDMSKHIHALETGLSSDPPMNWRLSDLDSLTLLSNSDAHSPWPWRLGREANVFELSRVTYGEIIDAIRGRDAKKLRFTIETDPAYGKYHWSGHRRCNFSCSAANANRSGNVCPRCRRKLTKGVEARVEELADRPIGYRPEKAIGYVHLLPLSEIIATSLGIGSESMGSPEVWSRYNSLVERFGDEFEVLLSADEKDIEAVAGHDIANAIIRVREGKVKVIPGYDGLYGRIVLEAGEPPPNQLPQPQPSERKGLDEYI